MLDEIKPERISEMVKMLDGEMKPHYSGALSIRTIERNYDSLGFFELLGGGDEVLQLLLHKNKITVVGVLTDKPGEEYKKIPFVLYFKEDKTFKNDWIQNPLQVDRVSIAKKYEGLGVSQFVYARLAKIGFTVVSDKRRYFPGKMLWKKIARLAELENYEVLVFDAENKLESKVYDGSNIDDSDIWNKNSDAEKVLLALKAKS